MRINLLPKEERPLKQSQVRWEFLVDIFGLLLLGVVILFSVMANFEVNDLAAQERDALIRETRLLEEVAIVNSIRRELTDLEAKEKTYQALLVPSSELTEALPALSNHSFPGIWIESIAWDDAEVVIRGYTQDTTSLSRYLYFLNERSDEVLLTSISAVGDTGFRMFRLDVKGVDTHASSKLY